MKHYCRQSMLDRLDHHFLTHVAHSRTDSSLECPSSLSQGQAALLVAPLSVSPTKQPSFVPFRLELPSEQIGESSHADFNKLWKQNSDCHNPQNAKHLE